MRETAPVLAAFGAILTTSWSLHLTAQANKATTDQIDLSRRQQAADRLSHAVDQLGQEGADKLSIRLGGVYALGSLMHDSNEEAPTVTSVLCDFIRVHLPIPANLDSHAPDAPIPADVLAAFSVLNSRPHPENHTYRLALSRVMLDGASLPGARLQGADLRGSKLIRADLTGADLSDSLLGGADLRDACLHQANLQRANQEGDGGDGDYVDLTDAHLSGADLRRASLQHADLHGPELNGADVRGTALPGRAGGAVRGRGAVLVGGDGKSPSGLAPAHDKCG